MEKLRAKMRKKGGFTLVEMLIVVAIVAILIAISIPLVNNALEKARHATDDANYRSAAALGTIKYLTEENVAGTYYYFTNNASQGKLAAKDATETGYSLYESKCECSAKNSATKTEPDAKIKVEIAATGEVTVSWDTTT